VPSFTSSKQEDVLRTAWRKSYAGLAAIGVFSIFINILKLATPLYVLQLLDRIVASRSHETLVMLTMMVLVAIVSSILLEVIRRRMFIHWGTWIERSFGPQLFAVGLQKDLGQVPSSSSMLRDISTIRSFVSGTGLIAWLDIIWAPLFVGCVFLISPPLAYIVLTAVLITLTLGTVNELTTRNSRDITYKARKDDREWISSAERNRETVGSLNMAANLAKRWSRSAFARLDEGMRSQILNIYFAAAMRFVRQCLRILVLGFGLWLVINQELTLGAVIAASVVGRIAYSLVENAMLKWREMMTAKRAYGRIKTFLGKDNSYQVSMSQTNVPVPLFIEQVSYRYPNQAASVFRGITVTVNPGEVLCVIGQSAMGKTTFSRLVTGLISPRSGKIRLGDVDVSRLPQQSTRRDIGYLPQDITLFQGTVRENIARMAEGHINRVIRAAKRAGVHETILKLPEAYDTEIVENEPLLSAGQRKSIAIARAYYASPALIVMDEPTPHLDEPARLALFATIARWKRKGIIVVLTTQSNELSRFADKVILLKSSKLDILQTPEDVAALQGASAVSSISSIAGSRDKNRKSDSTRGQRRDAEGNSFKSA
jgi:PrtD family type I secretion system ABC transporter